MPNFNIILSASGEVEFVIFATFSNGSHLGFSIYLKFIILKPYSQVMHHVKYQTINAEVSEKHLFSKLFSNVDRQWPRKDNQPTLDALV